MARKAVLEGGRRDEIIAAATELFFSNGFENTSVRMVLEKVGGEIGMFYHYFSSKDQLFNTVVERFFSAYTQTFGEIVRNCESAEELAASLLPLLEKSLGQYRMVEGAMHWTIQYAMHERTLISMIPIVEECLDRIGYDGRYPRDITAGRMVADLSAAIHSKSFGDMPKEEQQRLLTALISENLGI